MANPWQHPKDQTVCLACAWTKRSKIQSPCQLVLVHAGGVCSMPTNPMKIGQGSGTLRLWSIFNPSIALENGPKKAPSLSTCIGSPAPGSHPSLFSSQIKSMHLVLSVRYSGGYPLSAADTGLKQTDFHVAFNCAQFFFQMPVREADVSYAPRCLTHQPTLSKEVLRPEATVDNATIPPGPGGFISTDRL